MSFVRNPTNSNNPSVAIVGGGITGLSCAFELSQKRPNWKITLFEASDRLGGVIQTTQDKGFLIEHSADNFIVNDQIPWARDLCCRLGLEKELIPANSRFRRALIWFRGELHPVPEGFQLMSPNNWWAIAKSPLLSPLGKIRLAAERFIPRRSESTDESFESFAIRRLGREVYDRLVQPLVAGIYTADPKQLSMQAALPQFLRMEQEYGSITAAVVKQNRNEKSSGARYNQFWTLRAGLEHLIATLRSHLEGVSIRLGTSIQDLRHVERHWEIKHGTVENFDGVVLTLPTSHAARLVSQTNRGFSDCLQQTPFASSSVVCLGYRTQQFQRPPEAFGCVIPSISKRKILAISFASMKFPGRAPAGCQLLRVFIGGALQPELAGLPDDQLVDIACRETESIVGVHGDPDLVRIVRWPETMPQYHLGHLDRVSQVQEFEKRLPNFVVAGKGFDGVGIPQCIRSGWSAGERLIETIEGNS